MNAFGVEATLRRRAFLVANRGDYGQTIAPHGMQPTKIVTGGGCLPDWDNNFYNFMCKISFRKMIRFMLAHPSGVSEKELSEALSQASSTIRERLKYLSDSGVVEEQGKSQWYLTKGAPNNFGPTFERYIKSVFEREFICSSEWGVELEGFQDGDFDVLALVDSALCYVECKTAQTKDISNSELRYFLQRSQDLAPEMAILLVDTEDSLETLVRNVESILTSLARKESADQNWKPSKPFLREPSGFKGIYFGHRRIFVTNARPSVVSNLRLCLRFYSTWVKFQSFFGGPRFNYITEEILPL